MNAQSKVLIVGAGPTGLTLANDLARRGVPFDIVDRKSGPTSDSKGLALNVSSQYGLRLIGIDTPVGKHGMEISRLNLHWENARFSSVDFSHLSGALQSLITQPQSITEEELQLALECSGGRVEWNHRVTALIENSGSVAAKLVSSDGVEVLRRYDYVIGCDGKHSVVRKQLAVAFDGFDYDMHFTLGDFELDLPFDQSEVQYFVYPDTFFILVPIAIGRWRVVVKFSGAVPDCPPNVDDMEAVMARYFGEGFRLGEPSWISRAPFYNRVAQTIHKGRCFLAGDAAHLFSPIGGTGMNTGMQDAFNLGWKLASVIKGYSHKSLLDSYQQERLPAIQEAANISNTSTQHISAPDVSDPFIQAMAPKLVNRSFFKATFPQAHSGMAMRLNIDWQNESEGALAGGQVLSKPSCSGELNLTMLHIANMRSQTTSGFQSPDGPVFLVDVCALKNPVLRSQIKYLADALAGVNGAAFWYLSHDVSLAEGASALALGEITQRFEVVQSVDGVVIPEEGTIQIVRPDGITLGKHMLGDVQGICRRVLTSMKCNKKNKQIKKVAVYE